MSFKKLNEYLTDAKKYIFKKAPILKDDEDAISYVAYWGMIADKKFNPEINDSRDGYRALYYSFGLKKFFRKRRAKKDSINVKAKRIFDIKKDKNSQEYNMLLSLTAPKVEIHEEYIDIIKSLNFLSDRQKDIAIDYWIFCRTTREIGEKLGISYQRVAQHVEKIRELFKEHKTDV